MKNTQTRNLAILMYILIALGGVVVDIIVPSLPSIKSVFITTESAAQWAFTAAMLGFAVGQFFAGFVVDSYGRKKPMVIGVAVLSVAFFVSIYTPNIQTLILIRLCEGLAVSFVAVGGRAAIRDMFNGMDYLKAVNWITVSFALGITLSPFVGGYIEMHLGWKRVFLFMGVYSCIGMLLLMKYFSETSAHAHPFDRETMVSNLFEILFNCSFMRSALICGIFYSILPVFNTIAPFLVQHKLGYSPVFYGYLALWLGFCWLAGNLINRIAINVSASIKVSISLVLSIIAIMLGIDYQVLHGLNLFAFVAPVSVVIFSLGILFPLFLGKALAPLNHIAGLANAMVFSGSWLVTAIVSFVASYLSTSSAVPTLFLYAVLLLIVSLLYFFERDTRPRVIHFDSPTRNKNGK